MIFTVFYYAFKFLRAIYTSLYFYFFPLAISFVPIYRLAYIDQNKNDHPTHPTVQISTIE